MSLKVRVTDRNSGLVLFECPVSQTDRAYEAAAGFEAMGLDVLLDVPSVSATLADSLGVEGAPMDEFQESLAQEMDDHAGSCCFEEKSDKKLH